MHFYKTFQANHKRTTIKETQGKENIQFRKGFKRHPKKLNNAVLMY